MTVLSNIITPTNVLTASSTNTLTNKTWNSNTIGVAYGGTGVTASSLTSVGTLTGLTVGGDQNITGNLVIGQDLTVNGNTISTNITELNVEDPIISQGRGANNTPLTSNDGKDRGEQFWYFSGTEKSAFSGYDNSAGKMLLATDVSIANEIVTVNSLGNIVGGNIEATSVVTSGNVTASYVIGNGSLLSSITGANVTGTVANATYATDSAHSTVADSANAVAGGNVSGQVANALVAGTVYTAAQPAITSVGTLGSLTVTGTTNLGAVGNVTITGGTANALILSNVSIVSGNINNITSNASTFSNVTINGGTSNGLTETNVTITSGVVGNVTVNAYTEGVIAVGNTGNAVTINIANSTIVTATLTANCTFTMPGNTAGKSFTLILKTGNGSFTSTFTNVKWTSNTAPTITTTASRADILTFVADGANWYGNYAQNYTP